MIGHDGRFLCGFTNRFDSQSVLNEFGAYGSRFSSLSARKPFTSMPPRIIRNGTFIAFHTVIELLTLSVAPAFALTCAFP
jgi:hypothetical protein